MSFFHVLPSNVAPDTFPKNHASAYSTPIDNNYYLNGKWEVALMHMTYSGCINTFHNDQMTVEKSFNSSEALQMSNKPLRWTLNSKTRRDIVNEINTVFSGVVKVDMDEKGQYCQWSFPNSNVIAILSHHLKLGFGLWHDVIAPWDLDVKNFFPFKNDVSQTLPRKYMYIIIVPLTHDFKKISIKPANTNMETKDFIKSFNEQLTNILSIGYRKRDPNKLEMKKLHNDENLTVLSKGLLYMTGFHQAGTYRKGTYHYKNMYYYTKAFTLPWEVYVYQLNDIQDIGKTMSVPITLSPRSFKYEKDVITYLNDVMKDANITFSLSDNNILQMKIDSNTSAITFSDTLRDIFAFDQNSYSGKGTFSASDVLSLSRRIHYLYVYSNVNDYVRIGDTEAPLLAVIPFNPEKCVDLLQEKTFKLPMYVPVIQNPISQIDIGIYDGAGQLVPFVSNAVTSIRLHFRKV